MKKYLCTCGSPIKEMYEVCTAIWQKNFFDDKDEGKIVDYGGSRYTWKCTNKKCYDGDEWQHEPPEAPRCEDQTSEECTGYADVIEDETGDGYCASCVDMVAGYGYEEFILMQKQLKEASR